MLDVNELMVQIDNLSTELKDTWTEYNRLNGRLRELFDTRVDVEWRDTWKSKESADTKIKDLRKVIREKKQLAVTIIDGLDKKIYEQ